MYALSTVGAFLGLFAGEGFFGALFSFVVTAALTFFVYWLYLGQVTFARAKMGKHLNKYYGLEGDALQRQIDAIEAEGGKVVAALVLVDRQEGGREAIESRGIPVYPMFTRASIFGDK